MVVAHPDVVYKDADIQTTDFFNELQDLLKTIEAEQIKNMFSIFNFLQKHIWSTISSNYLRTPKYLSYQKILNELQ